MPSEDTWVGPLCCPAPSSRGCWQVRILLAPPPSGPRQGPHLSVQLRSVRQQCLGETLWVPGSELRGCQEAHQGSGTPPQGFFSIRLSYSAYGLPGGAAVKNQPAGARDGRRGFSPWVGRSLGQGVAARSSVLA